MKLVDKVRKAELPREALQRGVIAMQDLQTQYQQQQAALGMCPLCTIGLGCIDCPWLVFADGCRPPYRHARMRHSRKREARIRQLGRWIVAYKEILDAETNNVTK